MKSENGKSKRTFLLAFGIILMLIGINIPIFNVIALIGFVCIINGILSGKDKRNNTSVENVSSCIKRSMPVNNTQVRSEESHGYIHGDTENVTSTSTSTENTNECPICGDFSADGYCRKCGFRYRR